MERVRNEASKCANRPSPLGKTILVVDDDCEVRTLVQHLLERAGYRALTAGDGLEGIALFKKHSKRIALVLSDVEMPRMTGIQLADQVLSACPKVPVVFVSGVFTDADAGWGCIAKPFTPTQLIQRVREVLGESGPAPPARLC